MFTADKSTCLDTKSFCDRCWLLSMHYQENQPGLSRLCLSWPTIRSVTCHISAAPGIIKIVKYMDILYI